jgi:hypothetical protein
MKDIPMFTTEYGIASLSLQQIPYRGDAYVTVLHAVDLSQLLAECAQFCRMCGAQRIFATGHPDLERLPLHTHVIRMRGRPTPGETVCLWPVTAETAAQWRQIYNDRMRCVDNATALSAREERQLWDESGAYFIHDGEKLLGIGWLREKELLALASVVPGAGEVVLQTILSLAGEETITLEVASTNEKAIRLYEKLGFIKTQILRSWYCVQ